MEFNQKIYKVLSAIQSKYEITPNNTAILIHPKDETLKDLDILDIHTILKKLEKEYKVIQIESISFLSPYFEAPKGGRADLYLQIIESKPDKKRKLKECYEIILKREFNSFYEEFKKEFSLKYYTNSLSTESDKALWIYFNEQNRDIILNNIFHLSKPNFESINAKVFSYLFKNPNKIISIQELEREAKVELGSKRLHDIIKELGFTKELLQAFFSVKKNQIYFKNPISKQELEDLGIKNIKVTLK